MTPRFTAWLAARAAAEAAALDRLYFAIVIYLLWLGVSQWAPQYRRPAQTIFIALGIGAYLIFFFFGWSV